MTRVPHPSSEGEAEMVADDGLVWLGAFPGEPRKVTRMRRVSEIWADQGLKVEPFVPLDALTAERRKLEVSDACNRGLARLNVAVYSRELAAEATIAAQAARIAELEAGAMERLTLELAKTQGLIKGLFRVNEAEAARADEALTRLADAEKRGAEMAEALDRSKTASEVQKTAVADAMSRMGLGYSRDIAHELVNVALRAQEPGK